MMNYGYSGYHSMNGFGVFGIVLHVVFALLVIFLLIAAVRFLFGGGRRGMRRMGMWHAHSALSILNERFAKGEIEQKEYEERKKTLLGQ